MAFAECESIGWLLWPDINGSGSRLNLGDEASCWFDHARGTYCHEHGALLQRPENLVQLERHFAEPTDVGTNATAACAARKPGRRLINIVVFKWRPATGVAAALEKLAMHVNDMLRSRLFVQMVYVLGAEK